MYTYASNEHARARIINTPSRTHFKNFSKKFYFRLFVGFWAGKSIFSQKLG